MIEKNGLSLARGKVTLIYGYPTPRITSFIIDISIHLLENSVIKRVYIIDADNIFHPKDFLIVPEKFSNNIILYKPLSMKDVMVFLYRLYLTKDSVADSFVVLSSLYLHIDNRFYKNLMYDPVMVTALLKAIVNRTDVIALINVDTYVEEFEKLPLSNFLSRYIDLIYLRSYSIHGFTFK